MIEELYTWIHDDITWCGNECSHTECERNIVNKISKTDMYSVSMFKGTETCPLTKENKNERSE